MSQLLTICLMLYGICIVAPKRHIPNPVSARCVETVAASNVMEKEYPSNVDIIPGNVNQQCQSDTQPTREDASTPVQESDANQDFRELLNMSAYKVLVRKKRLTSTNYRDAQDHFFEYPVLSVDITLVFYLKSCSNKKKKTEITAKIRKVVCPKASDCQVKLKSECKSAYTKKRDPKLGPAITEYWVTASKGLPSGYRPSFCKPKCVIKNMKKFLKQEGIAVIQNSQRAYKFIRHSSKIKMRCPGGFTMHDDFMCLACGPGMYTTGVEKKCISCPTGHYQGKLGKKTCNKCPHGKTTAKKGATNVSYCKAGQRVAIAQALNSMKIMHYAAIGAAPIVIIICCLICCCASGDKKNTENKSLLLISSKTKGDTGQRPDTEFDKGSNTETENHADDKTIGECTPASASYVPEISNTSMGKEHSRLSIQQSRTGNSDNNRWIRTTGGWIRSTSHTFNTLDKSTRSQVLEKNANAENNPTPRVTKSCRVRPQNHIPMRRNQQNGQDKPQTDVMIPPADIPQCTVPLSMKTTSDLKSPTSRHGSRLADRLSVAQRHVCPSALPESYSWDYAVRVNSVDNNFYQTNHLPYWSCQLLENYEAIKARDHTFQSRQTNSKPHCQNRTFEALKMETMDARDGLAMDLKTGDGSPRVNLQSKLINDDQSRPHDSQTSNHVASVSLDHPGEMSSNYRLLKRTIGYANLAQKSTSVPLLGDAFVALPSLRLTTFPTLILGKHSETVSGQSPNLSSNIANESPDVPEKLHSDAASADLIDLLIPCNDVPLPPPPQPNINYSENAVSPEEFPSPPPPLYNFPNCYKK